MLNGYFELDTGSFTGATSAVYMTPTSWAGSTITSSVSGSIVIKYSDTVWIHANNANEPGTYFLGIQKVSSYVSQKVTVPPNTYFAVQFDVSARQQFAVATLDVYCNVAGNTGMLTTNTTTIIVTSSNTLTYFITNTNTNNFQY